VFGIIPHRILHNAQNGGQERQLFGHFRNLLWRALDMERDVVERDRDCDASSRDASNAGHYGEGIGHLELNNA